MGDIEDSDFFKIANKIILCDIRIYRYQARHLGEGGNLTLTGTFLFRAPEYLSGGMYTERADGRDYFGIILILTRRSCVSDFFCFRAPPLQLGCHAGVAVGPATNYFRWPLGQARSYLRSGRLPLILYALSHSFHVLRLQAGFRREIGYFPTKCPEPDSCFNFSQDTTE